MASPPAKTPGCEVASIGSVSIEPKGQVSINAIPWAEVFVDDERLGETPLANVPVTIGTREFVEELRAGGWEALEACEDPAIIAARTLYPLLVDAEDDAVPR